MDMRHIAGLMLLVCIVVAAFGIIARSAFKRSRKRALRRSGREHRTRQTDHTPPDG